MSALVDVDMSLGFKRESINFVVEDLARLVFIDPAPFSTTPPWVRLLEETRRRSEVENPFLTVANGLNAIPIILFFPY